MALPDPPLQVGDLCLRPWRLADAPALVAAWADEEIRRWTGAPARPDLEGAQRWIAGDAARRQDRRSLDLVVDRAGAVVGEVGLSGFDGRQRSAEIGWWTASSSRRAGVASAAVQSVLEWALGDLGLRRVTARCAAGNPASVAVALRAGLVPAHPGATAEVVVLVATRP